MRINRQVTGISQRWKLHDHFHKFKISIWHLKVNYYPRKRLNNRLLNEEILNQFLLRVTFASGHSTHKWRLVQVTSKLIENRKSFIFQRNWFNFSSNKAICDARIRRQFNLENWSKNDAAVVCTCPQCRPGNCNGWHSQRQATCQGIQHALSWNTCNQLLRNP